MPAEDHLASSDSDVAATGERGCLDRDMPDLHLDALASLEAHADAYAAFSDEDDDEEEDELQSVYLVRACTRACRERLPRRALGCACMHMACTALV